MISNHIKSRFSDLNDRKCLFMASAPQMEVLDVPQMLHISNLLVNPSSSKHFLIYVFDRRIH